MDSRAAFIDDDLGNEGLGAVFASLVQLSYPCCPDFWLYRTGAGRLCRSALRQELVWRVCLVRYDWNPKSTTKSYHRP